MTRRIFACCMTLALLAAADLVCGADAKGSKKPKPEPVEKTGIIEVQKADVKKKEKYDTILLKVGEETFKLFPDKGKDIRKKFKALEGLGGKQVTVKGEFLPADPPKYPLAAIRVEEFSEATGQQPAVTPPPNPKRADPAPAPAPAPTPAGK